MLPMLQCYLSMLIFLFGTWMYWRSCKAWTRIHWHMCWTSLTIFTCLAPGLWWIPHLIEHFKCALQETYYKRKAFECWPFWYHFNNLLITGYYFISQNHEKVFFLILMIFYVHIFCPFVFELYKMLGSK